MKKFQFVTVNLYNHYFTKPRVVEGVDVVDACVKCYDDPDLYEQLNSDLDSNKFKKYGTGLGNNRHEGSWVWVSDEELIMITELSE